MSGARPLDERVLKLAQLLTAPVVNMFIEDKSAGGVGPACGADK